MFNPNINPGHPIEAAAISNALSDLANYAVHSRVQRVVDVSGNASRTVVGAVPVWITTPPFPMSGGKEGMLLGPLVNNADDTLSGIPVRGNAVVEGHCKHGPVVGTFPCRCSTDNRLIVFVNTMHFLSDLEIVTLMSVNNCYSSDDNKIVFVSNIIPQEGFAANLNGEGFQANPGENSIGVFRGDSKMYHHARPTKSMIEGRVEAASLSVLFVPLITKRDVIVYQLIPAARFMDEAMPIMTDWFAGEYLSYAGEDLIPGTSKLVPTWGVIKRQTFNQLTGAIKLSLADWTPWTAAIGQLICSSKYCDDMKPMSVYFWTKMAVLESFRILSMLSRTNLIGLTDFKAKGITGTDAVMALFAEEIVDFRTMTVDKIREYFDKAKKVGKVVLVAFCVFIALVVPGGQIALIPLMLGVGVILVTDFMVYMGDYFNRTLTEEIYKSYIDSSAANYHSDKLLDLTIREIPSGICEKAVLLAHMEITKSCADFDLGQRRYGIVQTGTGRCLQCRSTHVQCKCGVMACESHIHRQSILHPVRRYIDEMKFDTHSSSCYVIVRQIQVSNVVLNFDPKATPIRLIADQVMMPCYGSTRVRKLSHDNCTMTLDAVDNEMPSYGFGHGLKVPLEYSPATRLVNRGWCYTHAITATGRSFDPSPTCMSCSSMTTWDRHPDTDAFMDKYSKILQLGAVQAGKCFDIVDDSSGLRANQPLYVMTPAGPSPVVCNCGNNNFVYLMPTGRGNKPIFRLTTYVVSGWTRRNVMVDNVAYVLRTGDVVENAGRNFVVTNRLRCGCSLASYGPCSFNNYLGRCSVISYLRMDHYVNGLGCPNCYRNPGCTHIVELPEFSVVPWATSRALMFAFYNGDVRGGYINGVFDDFMHMLHPKLLTQTKANGGLAENNSCWAHDEMTRPTRNIGANHLEKRPSGDYIPVNMANAAHFVFQMNESPMIEKNLELDNVSIVSDRIKDLRSVISRLKKATFAKTIQETQSKGCDGNCLNDKPVKCVELHNLAEFYPFYEFLTGFIAPRMRTDDISRLTIYQRVDFSTTVYHTFRNSPIGLYLLNATDSDIQEHFGNTMVAVEENGVTRLKRLKWDRSSFLVSKTGKTLWGTDFLHRSRADIAKTQDQDEYFLSMKDFRASFGIFGFGYDRVGDFWLNMHVNRFLRCPLHNANGLFVPMDVNDSRTWLPSDLKVDKIHNDYKTDCLRLLLQQKGLLSPVVSSADFDRLDALCLQKNFTFRMFYLRDGQHLVRLFGFPDPDRVRCEIIVEPSLAFNGALHASYCISSVKTATVVVDKPKVQSVATKTDDKAKPAPLPMPKTLPVRQPTLPPSPVIKKTQNDRDNYDWLKTAGLKVNDLIDLPELSGPNADVSSDAFICMAHEPFDDCRDRFVVIADGRAKAYCRKDVTTLNNWTGAYSFLKQGDKWVVGTIREKDPIGYVDGEKQYMGNKTKTGGYDVPCDGQLITGGPCPWMHCVGQTENACRNTMCHSHLRKNLRTSQMQVIKRRETKLVFTEDYLNVLPVDLSIGDLDKAVRDFAEDNPVKRAVRKMQDNQKFGQHNLRFYLVNGAWGTGKSTDFSDHLMVVPTRFLKNAAGSDLVDTPHLVFDKIKKGVTLVVDEAYLADIALLVAYQLVTEMPLILLGDFVQFTNERGLPHNGSVSNNFKRIWKPKIFRNCTRLQMYLTHHMYTCNPDWKDAKGPDIEWDCDLTSDTIIDFENLSTTYSVFSSEMRTVIVTPKTNSDPSKHDKNSEDVKLLRRELGEEVEIVSSFVSQGINTRVDPKGNTSLAIIFYIPKFVDKKKFINLYHLIPITRFAKGTKYAICVNEGYAQFMEFYNSITTTKAQISQTGQLGRGCVVEDIVVPLPEVDIKIRTHSDKAMFKFKAVVDFLAAKTSARKFIDATMHEGTLKKLLDNKGFEFLGGFNKIGEKTIHVFDNCVNNVHTIDNAGFMHKIKNSCGDSSPKDVIIICDWTVRSEDGQQVNHAITPLAAITTVQELLRCGYKVLSKWNHGYRENYFKKNTKQGIMSDFGFLRYESIMFEYNSCEWFTHDGKEIFYLHEDTSTFGVRAGPTLPCDRNDFVNKLEVINGSVFTLSSEKPDAFEGDYVLRGPSVCQASNGPCYVPNTVATLHSHIDSCKCDELSTNDKFIFNSNFYRCCLHLVARKIDVKQKKLSVDVWVQEYDAKTKKSRLTMVEQSEINYVVDRELVLKRKCHTVPFSPKDKSHALFHSCDMDKGLAMLSHSPLVKIDQSRLIYPKNKPTIAYWNSGIPFNGFLGFAFGYDSGTLATAIAHRALGIQNASSLFQFTTAQYMVNFMQCNRDLFFAPLGSLICPKLEEVLKGFPSNRKKAITNSSNVQINGSEKWKAFPKGDEVNITGTGAAPRAIISPPTKMLKRDLPVASAFTKYYSEANSTGDVVYTGCMRSDEIGEVLDHWQPTMILCGDIVLCDRSARSWENRIIAQGIFDSIDTSTSEWHVEHGGWGSMAGYGYRVIISKGIRLIQIGTVPSGVAFTNLFNTIKAKWIICASAHLTCSQRTIYTSDDFDFVDPNELFLRMHAFLARGMNWLLKSETVPTALATYNSQLIISAYHPEKGKTLTLAPKIVRGHKRYFIKTNLDYQKQLQCLNYAEQYGCANTPILRAFWKAQVQKFGTVKELTERWKMNHRYNLKPYASVVFKADEDFLDNFMETKYGLPKYLWRHAEAVIAGGSMDERTQGVLQHILLMDDESSSKLDSQSWQGDRQHRWDLMIATTDKRPKACSYPVGVSVEE